MEVQDKNPRVTVEGYDESGPDESLAIKQTRVKRIFSYMQTLFMALVYMSSWEAILGNLLSVFLNGGPSSLSWGVTIAGLGACTQAASLAEMSSMLPIAGAQYHWVWILAPRESRRFITWMQGWLSWFSWVSILLAVSNIIVTTTQSLVILNSPDYAPERWQTTLIVWLVLILFSIMNVYVFRIVPYIETLSGILHIVLYPMFMIVFLVMSRGRYNSSEFVWTSTVSTTGVAPSGWDNSFVSWNLGLLTSCWAFVGFDNTAHLGEEVRLAPKTVPRVIWLSIALNAIPAWAMAITMLYCMRSIDDAIDSPGGYPLTGIVMGITGSKGATTFMISTLIFLIASNVLTNIASVSRLTWAWARDGGLPKMFSIVSEARKVPVKAIILSSFLAALISVLNIPSTVAFQVFIALSTFGLYVTYIISIGCMLHARLTRPHELSFGSWTMGKYGLIINIVALVYSVYISIWLVFPASLPISGENMQYALPVFSFFTLISLVLWFIYGRSWKGVNEKVVRLAVSD